MGESLVKEKNSRRNFLRKAAWSALALGTLGVEGVLLSQRKKRLKWFVRDEFLEPGDFLFRRTVSLAGLSEQMMDSAGRYSHVGMVVGHGCMGRAMVVHACPPSHPDEAGVRMETAGQFVGARDVMDATAKRLRIEPVQKKVMSQWASSHVGWNFNADFRLGEPHALYCTELIWEAMRAANTAHLPKLQRWVTPLGELTVVPMAGVLDLPELIALPDAVRSCNEAAMQLEVGWL